MELVAYMLGMRIRSRSLVRTAMAVVFGFMSLVHGPVMTFAKAGSAPAHPAVHHASHHHTAPEHDPHTATPDAAPICYAFGCFIALDAVVLKAPAMLLNPIGALSPARAEALHGDDIKPAVPPPRLHV